MTSLQVVQHSRLMEGLIQSVLRQFTIRSVHESLSTKNQIKIRCNKSSSLSLFYLKRIEICFERYNVPIFCSKDPKKCHTIRLCKSSLLETRHYTTVSGIKTKLDVYVNSRKIKAHHGRKGSWTCPDPIEVSEAYLWTVWASALWLATQ